MNGIIFNSGDKLIPVRKRKIFKKCLYKLFTLEGCKLQKITYIFCSDEYILELNNRYLNHNYYTDILTFLIPTENHLLESEIYISTDRIKENAKIFKVSYQMELLRVMIHGALHLCGYDDQNQNARIKMQKKEDFYIQLYDSRET